MMDAEKLLLYYRNMESPEDIFKVYEEFQNLPDNEKDKFRNLGIGDAVSMKYITAVEMKKDGTWEEYLEEWKKNKSKSGKERLYDRMFELGML